MDWATAFRPPSVPPGGGKEERPLSHDEESSFLPPIGGIEGGKRSGNNPPQD